MRTDGKREIGKPEEQSRERKGLGIYSLGRVTENSMLAKSPHDRACANRVDRLGDHRRGCLLSFLFFQVIISVMMVVKKRV